MNFLNKLKISTKLIIMISIMLFGILIVGGVGSYYNNKSHEALTDMYKDRLSPVQLLNDARTQSRANKANMLDLILNKDAARQKDILTDIDTRKKNIENIFSQYSSTPLDTYEKEHYAMAQKTLSEWNTTFNKAIELSTSGKSNEAYELYISSGNKSFEDFQTTIRDLANYNSNLAQQVYTKNELNAKNAATLLIFFICLISAICVLLGILITKSVTTPMKNLVKLIDKTANLDLIYDDSTVNDLIRYKGEIGTISSAVIKMRKALRETINTILVISNNLTSHSLELSSSAEENTKSINQVASTINEIADGNSKQAEMVTSTSEVTNDIVKTIDEVNKTTNENVQNAELSLETVYEGQKSVVLVNESMDSNIKISNEVSKSILELSESIEKVGNIIDVINSISEQTNLLALNAAIEAARAGEAGKGFAVVSEEIRKLAEGSSSAAAEITSIVKDTMEKSSITTTNIEKAKNMVEKQSKAVSTTKEAFDKIKLSVENISNQTKNTASMLNNIYSVSKEISEQTQEMSAVAEQSAASSEEISATTEEQLASIETISNAASELSSMAEDLSKEINKFKI